MSETATPTSPRPEPASAQETALIVVDMQNSYFEFPALAEKKDELVPAVNELIRAAREAGRPILLVRTEHARDRSTWTLNMLEDDQGFAFPGTDQARLLPELEVGEDRVVEIVKTRDSAFHRTDLDEQLHRLGVGSVLICGVSTHSCVSQTAIDAFAHQYHAAVAVDAVASENQPLSDALLDFLELEMRQPALEQAEAVRMLREGGVPRSPQGDHAGGPGSEDD